MSRARERADICGLCPIRFGTTFLNIVSEVDLTLKD